MVYLQEASVQRQMQKQKKGLIKKFSQVNNSKINFDTLSREAVLCYISTLKKIAVLLKFLQKYVEQAKVTLLPYLKFAENLAIKNVNFYKSGKAYGLQSNMYVKNFYKVLKYVKKNK